MKIVQVHHIAVSTIDINESIKFYKEMLGFQLAQRADMGIAELVYMKISDDTYMELFNLKGNCKTDRIDEASQGLRHIAFDVEDIEEWDWTLKSKHANYVAELMQIKEINSKCLLIEDPNGVIIELRENL